MLLRRTLLKLASAGAVAAPTLGVAAESAAGIDALLLDRRFALPDALASGSVPVLTIDGDVTGVWLRELDPRWREPGFVLEGVTGADALFVLERLCWDRGRRVTVREDISTADGVQLVHWLIEPVHPSVRAV